MKLIDEMPGGGPTHGRPRRYDWSEIFDGRARQFEPEDFAGTPADFGRQVRRAARMHPGLDINVVTRSDPPSVFVQAVDRMAMAYANVMP